MAWICPGCYSSNADESARCVCGLEAGGGGAAGGAPRARKPWYCSSNVDILSFLFFMPLWIVIQFINKEASGKRRMLAFLLAVGIVAYLYLVLPGHFSDGHQTTPASPQQSLPVVPSTRSAEADAANPANFNTTDKSMESNGNLAVALRLIQKSTPATILQGAQHRTTAELTRNPYAFLGRICKISGTVYKVEAVPPDPHIRGQWCEILLLSENQNSALGATTIDFFYNGDPMCVPLNSKITCAGYFVATYESQNAFGGTVEALLVVGNAINSDHKARPIPKDEASASVANVIKPSDSLPIAQDNSKVQRPTVTDVVEALRNKNKN